MNTQPSIADPFGRIADEFVEAYRAGKRPSLDEFAARYPEQADEIRDLLPALVLVEQAKSTEGGGPPIADNSCRALDSKLPRVLGDYSLIREIGRGGMGIVYEAEQVSLGRRVAIKVLPQHLLVNDKHRRRFEREAKAAAKLVHANIVPVFGVGEQDGVLYYVMQYIQGLGLDDVLLELRRIKTDPRLAENQPHPATEAARSLIQGEQTPANVAADESPQRPASSPRSTVVGAVLETLPGSGSSGSPERQRESDSGPMRSGRQSYWRSVARIGVQVASALDYAHRQGVVHRDIKPSNLLLDTRGTVWVTDFGLASVDQEHDVTRTGDMLGTLRYMPPEAFRGETDARSDIYSLGLTLYEMVAVEPAFDERDRQRLIQQLTTGEPRRLAQAAAEVPRDLATIVHKSIEREPHRRYASASALFDDLCRFLQDRPIRARPSGRIERSWRWCRRNPALAGTLALVGLLFAAISAVSLGAAVWLSKERGNTLANLGRAESAEASLTDQLWRSYVAQARALRYSGEPGRRFESLAALEKAWALVGPLSPNEDLRREFRNEVIACLALADQRTASAWDIALPRHGCIVFDAGLTQFAFADEQGSIVVRRARDSAEMIRITGPGQPAVLMQFSPNGRHIASLHYTRLGEQFAAIVWSLEDGKQVLRVPAPVPSSAMAFSPDGRYLAVGEPDGSIALHDLTGVPLATPVPPVEPRRFPKGAIPYALAFRPDGRRLAVSSYDGQVQIRDVATGGIARTLSHGASVRGLAWSADGARLVAACGGEVVVWDADQGRRLAIGHGHEGTVVAVAFSPQGNLLASTGWDSNLRLWDAATGLVLQVRAGANHGRIAGLQFSADGRYLASLADNSRLQLLEVVEGSACRVLNGGRGPSFGHVGGGFSADGRWLAAAGADKVRIWDLRSGQVAATLPITGHAMIYFAPDGESVVTTGDQGVQRWKISEPPGLSRRSDSEVLTIGSPETLWTGFPLTRGSMTSDRKWLMAGSRAPQAVIVNLQDPKQSVKLDFGQDSSFTAISPNGRWAAAGSFSGLGVKIWDLPSGKAIHSILPRDAATVCFSPDSRLFATFSVHTLSIWETDGWKVRFTVPRKNHAVPGFAQFSPDGKFIAANLEQNLVSIIESKSGRHLAKLEGPRKHDTTWLGFNADGSLLAVANANDQIQLWDLRALRAELSHRGLDW
jgi:serine/threonine protein kinase/WD40 repeat protein